MRRAPCTFVAALVVLAGTPSAQTPSSSPEIPLVAGLTIATAFQMDVGDGESLQRVETIDAQGVHIMFSGEITKPSTSGLDALLGVNTPAKPGAATNRFRVRRLMRAADRKIARHYQALYGSGQPAVFPGSTSMGTSALVLNDLKKGLDTQFSCQCGSGLSAIAGGIGGALSTLFGEMKEVNQLADMGKLAGSLKRVETTPIPVPVLVNNQRVHLPAIHAMGTLGGEASEFFFLDDPDNPIALRFRVGTQGLQVVKISFPTSEPKADIASVLESAGRVDVYGIYFDFGSAAIKPESEPVLKEIAGALASHPTWKLGVEGHTDNIGPDAQNLDLSQRRAVAVKDALVMRYKIAATRLATAGFGESRPKEPNDTIEGRARNRRVELVRN